jgi:hypothetical protein
LCGVEHGKQKDDKHDHNASREYVKEFDIVFSRAFADPDAVVVVTSDADVAIRAVTGL